jgi:hypothetical protein
VRVSGELVVFHWAKASDSVKLAFATKQVNITIVGASFAMRHIAATVWSTVILLTYHQTNNDASALFRFYRHVHLYQRLGETQRLHLQPKAIHVGFMVGKVAAVQNFFGDLRFSPVSIISPVLHISSVSWAMNTLGAAVPYRHSYSPSQQ